MGFIKSAAGLKLKLMCILIHKNIIGRLIYFSNSDQSYMLIHLTFSATANKVKPTQFSFERKVKLAREDAKNKMMPFLNCDIHIGDAGCLNAEEYQIPAHTDQYLRFTSPSRTETVSYQSYQADNTPL